MDQPLTTEHDRDLFRVKSLLASPNAMARAARDLRRWFRQLDGHPGRELSRVVRGRLAGLERSPGKPKKCGPEPRMSAWSYARKLRREQMAVSSVGPLATFLGPSWGLTPPPKPVPIRR